MAISKIPQASQLAVRVQTGLNAGGKPVYKAYAFKNVKTNALDADVYAVGDELARLQKYPVISVSRVDEGDLISQ